jgi:hypothetical protein
MLIPIFSAILKVDIKFSISTHFITSLELGAKLPIASQVPASI